MIAIDILKSKLALLEIEIKNTKDQNTLYWLKQSKKHLKSSITNLEKTIKILKQLDKAE